MQLKTPLLLPESSKVSIVRVNFEHGGQRVLTTKQLIKLFECDEGAIRKAFYRHKGEFEEGVDYFKLKGEILSQFKSSVRNYIHDLVYVAEKDLKINVAEKDANDDAKLLAAMLEDFIKGPALMLWTGRGVFKHSRIIGTKIAENICWWLTKIYFKEIETEPPAQINLFPNSTEEMPPTSNAEQLDRLGKFIDKCAVIKNETLRDNLIREAAKIILGKEI